MRSLILLLSLALLVHSTNANFTGGSTIPQQNAFCSSDGRQNSNYCFEESLSGTYIIRCRNGIPYLSDCADLLCSGRVTNHSAFFNCYEHTVPDFNGDGRAQCVADNTVYADNGSSYPVPPPDEVSTPSPDYAGQTFVFYPLSGAGSFCGTGTTVPPNETLNSPTGTGLGSQRTGSQPTGIFSGNFRPTGTTFPGSGSNTRGNGTGVIESSTPTPVPFTGVASAQGCRISLMIAMSGALMCMIL